MVPGSQQDFIANVSSDRIFFDLDQYNVDAQDQSTLQSQAQWLARSPRGARDAGAMPTNTRHA